MDDGLLILRVVVGVALIRHGTQKLFGWFGGHGRQGTGAFFELLENRPGARFAIIAGLSEAGGGALLALGFLTSVENALGLEWSAAWRRGGVALGIATAIATLPMRRPASAQPALASGQDKPLRKAA